MKNKKKTMISLFVIFDIVIVVVLITWAWIEGTTNPGIEGSNMQISASAGLLMKVDGQQTNVINLNDYCSDPAGKTLTLAEASSADGKEIWLRKTSDSEASNNNDNIHLRHMDSTDMNSTYLSIDFTLTSLEGTQKIFLDSSKSFIKDKNSQQPLNAVRMSLEVQPVDNEGKPTPNTNSTTTIMSMRNADQSSDFTVQKGVRSLGDGEILIDDSDTGNQQYMEKVNVYPLQGYSKDKPWINSLGTNETIKVTLRLWLEGTDDECLDNISGSSLDFHLYFDADRISN